MDISLITWLLIFALVLPVLQLIIFSVILYYGLKLYVKILGEMTGLIDKLGEAFIEDRQTYRMIGELVKEERKASTK